MKLNRRLKTCFPPDANQLIENTIREIRENKAEKEKPRRSGLSSKILKEKPSPRGSGRTAASRRYLRTGKRRDHSGSYVKISGQTAIGEVLSVKGKDAEIRIGDLKSTIKLNRLEKVSRKTYRAATGEKGVKTVSKGVDMNERMLNFSFNLDMRGKRGEEALGMVDQFMDNAIMLGYDELRIVHGKGDGILRDARTRNHLRDYAQVAGMYDEHADRGGAGVTIVKLK